MIALAGSQAIVLREVTAAAERGDVCPTNLELGEIVAGGTTVAGPAMLALEKKGLITVRRFARARQVTIVATGQSTRLDGNHELHWRSKAPARGPQDRVAT